MKSLFLLLFFIPGFSLAECNIKPDEIKPRVREILAPLHKKFNILIKENEFRLANRNINEIMNLVKTCESELKSRSRLEYKNINYQKEMNIYWLYSSELKGIEMQLRAGYESFELGYFRPFMFKVGMWELVANEFYEKEI